MRNKTQYQKVKWQKKEKKSKMEKWKTNKDSVAFCLHGDLIISAARQG